MKFSRAGDRSAGICEVCHSQVITRMEYRDDQPPGWDVTVPEVLVAACERCGHVVGIPHQSTPRINEHRKAKPSAGLTVSIGARVPREIDEALDLVTVALGVQAKAIRPVVIRYYLGQLVKSSRLGRDPEPLRWVTTQPTRLTAQGHDPVMASDVWLLSAFEPIPER